MNCAIEGEGTHCQKHLRHILECVAELAGTNNRLNRRCQEAESAARTKVDEVLRAGPSLGRALSAWAAGDYRRRLEEAEKRLKEAEKKIAPPELVEKACGALRELAAHALDIPEHVPCNPGLGFSCPCARCRHDAVNAVLRGNFHLTGL